VSIQIEETESAEIQRGSAKLFGQLPRGEVHQAGGITQQENFGVLGRVAGFGLMDENGAFSVERWARRGQQVQLHAEMHDDGEQCERQQGQAGETKEIFWGELANVAFHAADQNWK
jgi:hypothetical protein